MIASLNFYREEHLMTTRTWLDPQDATTRLVALTDNAICFADLKNDDAEQAARRIENGDSLAEVLGPNVTQIPLRSLNGITLDRAGGISIQLLFEGEKSPQRHNLSIHQTITRDAIYAALRDATSSRFDEFVDQYSRPRAAFASLATLTTVGIFTGLFASAAADLAAADEVDITGSRRGLKYVILWVMETLGPWGISILGGLVGLAVLSVLASRVRQPQLMYVLQAQPYTPSPAWVTSVKYALLLGVWGFCLWRFAG